LATPRDVWGGAWGNAWLLAWTVTESDETFSGGYFDGSEKRSKKKKTSYEKQMEGLAQLPIINRHFPIPLEVDKLVGDVSIGEDTEEDEIKAIMLLIH
jgi:hypothetical protein